MAKTQWIAQREDGTTVKFGWVAKYKDGRIISEWDFDGTFSQLPDRNDISAVALVLDDRSWVIRNKQHYYASKGEMLHVILHKGMSNPKVEIPKARILASMSIGYWENGRKVQMTVDTRTGEMHGPYEVPA